jgi:mRNA interferase YafQ
MKLFRTKTFKKDYQKLKMSDSQYTKYIKFLSLLLAEKTCLWRQEIIT